MRPATAVVFSGLRAGLEVPLPLWVRSLVVPESDGYAYDAVSGNENSVVVGEAGVGGGGFGGVAEAIG